jgi:hypothetical protein
VQPSRVGGVGDQCDEQKLCPTSPVPPTVDTFADSLVEGVVKVIRVLRGVFQRFAFQVSIAVVGSRSEGCGAQSLCLIWYLAPS